MLSVEHIEYLSGNRPIVDDVSISVGQGEIIGLVGPSGAGKSTILRCISGLLRPNRGCISINQTEITNVCIPERPIAFMQQSPVLYDQLSIFENVLVSHGGTRAPNEIRQAALDLLQIVGLSKSILDGSPTHLSGGEIQRVALCKALIREASVLLLDEPFSNLDKRRRRELAGIIRQRAQSSQLSVVVVSHDEVDVMFLADRVAIIEGGKIVQTGRVDDLHSRPYDEQAASFGLEAGLQVVQVDELDGIARDGLRQRASAFVDCTYVAWRSDRSRLSRSEPATALRSCLHFRGRIERVTPGTGGVFIQIELNPLRRVWHFQPDHVTLESDVSGETFLSVPLEHILALDGTGRLIW